MARLSEAARIEVANEVAALGYFDEVLKQLPDPRRPQGRRYPLRSVIVIALMSMVSGCDDAEAMEVWGDVNAEWLKTFLDLPHGTPTQDVFLHVLGALDPAEFQKVYLGWASLISLRLGAPARHIAIDGKTSRRSHDRGRGQSAIHTVSAYLTGAGLVLGQRQVDAKSNEIIAIPELLKVLDLRGATVTIDAMGCQTAIAEQIDAAGGRYLLSVKENQPGLLAEVKETFIEAGSDRPRTVEEPGRPVVDIVDEVDKRHGRIERRQVRVTTALDWVLSADRWKGLSYLVEVRREREVLATGKISRERAYLIGNGEPPSAGEVAGTTRGHWEVENNLHWVLDMAFREDEARHRARNTAANLTTLRHFALSMVQRDPTRKLGVANSRKRAGFDRAYLLHIVQGQHDVDGASGGTA